MNKQGWKVKKLGDIICFQNGFAFQSSKFRNNGLAILRIGNIENGMINTEDLIFFHKKDYSANLDNYIVNKDDILIAMSGATTGKVAIFNLDETFYINQRVGKITTSSFINNSYVYYFLQIRKEDTFALASGAAQPNISASEIKNISIFVPPLSTQNKIVKELDTLQAIISKKKAQLVELDNLAQATFYEMFGDPVENDREWAINIWCEILAIYNGRNQKKVEDPKGKYPICGSAGVMGAANSYICPENTIILGRKGNINKPIFMQEKFWNVDTAFGLVANTNCINPLFLFYFCKNYNFEKHNKAVTIPSLTKSDLLRIEMPTPPLNLQNQFAKRIEAIEKQKALINQSISETQLLFDSAMDNYFN